MAKFIEITVTVPKGRTRVLVNLDHVEEVRDEDGRCTIYFAYDGPNNIDQDYITPEESYSKVRDMILEAGC